MDAEHMELLHNQTWHLVPMPKGKKISSGVNVYIKSRRRPMALLIVIKPVWLLKDINNIMAWTMKTPSAQLLRPQPYA